MKFILIFIILTISLFSDVNFVKDKNLNRFITEVKAEGASNTTVKEITGYINKKFKNDNTKYEAFDYVIDRIGKRHLSKFPAKIRFYLSGPNDLEMFALIGLKKKGVDNESIANILLNAHGAFAPLGKKAKTILKNNGFNKKVLSIIENYQFLSSGSKTLRMKDLITMANNGVSEKKISDLIIASDMKNIKYTKQGIKFLLSLGLSKHTLYTLVYRDLLISGPSDYKIYDIYIDHKRKKLSQAKIIKKINQTNWCYKDFSEREMKRLSDYGISKPLVNATVKLTKNFTLKTSQATNESLMQMTKKDKTHKLNFVNMKNKLMGQARSNNSVLSGIKNKKEDSTGTTVLKTAGKCVARVIAMKACDQVPFPLNLACTALAKNQLECGI